MKVKLQNQFLSSQFSGTWTPSFFEFTGKLSKFKKTSTPLSSILVDELNVVQKCQFKLSL